MAKTTLLRKNLNFNALSQKSLKFTKALFQKRIDLRQNTRIRHCDPDPKRSEGEGGIIHEFMEKCLEFMDSSPATAGSE